MLLVFVFKIVKSLFLIEFNEHKSFWIRFFLFTKILSIFERSQNYLKNVTTWCIYHATFRRNPSKFSIQVHKKSDWIQRCLLNVFLRVIDKCWWSLCINRDEWYLSLHFLPFKLIDEPKNHLRKNIVFNKNKNVSPQRYLQKLYWPLKLIDEPNKSKWAVCWSVLYHTTCIYQLMKNFREKSYQDEIETTNDFRF